MNGFPLGLVDLSFEVLDGGSLETTDPVLLNVSLTMKSGSSAILLLKSPARTVSQSFGILFRTSVRRSSVVTPEFSFDAL